MRSSERESSVASAGRGLDIPLAPPVMPLHCEATLRSASPLRRITYTRTGGFCFCKLLGFLSGRTQKPPVLWLTESACSCPEQPLSATHARQRYNTLVFAHKVVCHETAGFIGFFLPRQRCRLWKPLPTGCSRPYWRLRAKGTAVPLESQLVLKGMPTKEKWFVDIHFKTQTSPEHHPIRR